MVVTIFSLESVSKKRKRKRRKRHGTEEKEVRVVSDQVCAGDPLCFVKQVCVFVCIDLVTYDRPFNLPKFLSLSVHGAL